MQKCIISPTYDELINVMSAKEGHGSALIKAYASSRCYPLLILYGEIFGANLDGCTGFIVKDTTCKFGNIKSAMDYAFDCCWTSINKVDISIDFLYSKSLAEALLEIKRRYGSFYRHIKDGITVANAIYTKRNEVKLVLTSKGIKYISGHMAE